VHSTEHEQLAANRANWDERTGIHRQSRFYDVDGWLRDGRGPPARETEVLGDVNGLSLLHLECHFGMDTLSWARAGARVTGLDFSEPAISAARDLAHRAGLADRAMFVCADVLDAVNALNGDVFDVVYVSLGAIPWLPRVDQWASQVGALVAPGGRFYLHDSHPVASALADGLTFEHSYFEEDEPFVYEAETTYTDGATTLTNQRIYQWNHGIGETVTALIRHGLQLDWLVEHDWTSFARFPWLIETGEQQWVLPPDRPRVPLSFSILAHRPARP
jgi:SAM-dependent methyltransferase